MSIRLIVSCFAMSFALTGAAQAVEVKRSIEVDGINAEIWAKIGGWCAIADWHPAVAKCEEGEADGKKTRTLTTGDGGVIKETLLETGETSYSYRIDESPLPVENYQAAFEIEEDDNEAEARITWSAEFDPKGDEAEAKKVIQGIFDGGLAEIKKGL